MAAEPVPEYPQYNYPHFLAGPDELEFESFQNTMRVGEIAPDFPALRLEDGTTVRLGDYTARGNVVVEFGSFT